MSSPNPPPDGKDTVVFAFCVASLAMSIWMASTSWGRRDIYDTNAATSAAHDAAAATQAASPAETPLPISPAR